MPAIDEQTPHVGVIDNRNLSVREVAYWRRDASELKPESRVTAQQYDAAGRLVAQRDPRFLAPGSRPNTATVYSLSGTALCTENLDAGWRLGLPDGTGQMREHWDGRGSHWQLDYDVQRRSRPATSTVFTGPMRRNAANLLERTSFGGKVYRADRRKPEEVLNEGFQVASPCLKT